MLLTLWLTPPKISYIFWAYLAHMIIPNKKVWLIFIILELFDHTLFRKVILSSQYSLIRPKSMSILLVPYIWLTNPFRYFDPRTLRSNPAGIRPGHLKDIISNKETGRESSFPSLPDLSHPSTCFTLPPSNLQVAPKDPIVLPASGPTFINDPRCLPVAPPMIPRSGEGSYASGLMEQKVGGGLE